MSVIYLRHFEYKFGALRYDTESGEASELEVQETEDGAQPLAWTQGYYVNYASEWKHMVQYTTLGADYAGFYAGPQGPVFFHNAERVLLEPERFRGRSTRKAEGEWEFALLRDGDPCLRFAYRGPPPPVYLWPEDDEDLDLLQWMSKYLPSPWFYQKYKVS